MLVSSAFYYEQGDYAKALPPLGPFLLAATIVCGLEQTTSKAAKKNLNATERSRSRGTGRRELPMLQQQF